MNYRSKNIVSAVVGLVFGDEGKGKVTDHLCSKLASPISVVRYSGGQQAGHHVISEDGFDHVYSNFGSGAHRKGVTTHWSKYCTVDPVGIHYELKALQEKGANLYLYLDYDCPITTKYEKWYNKYKNNLNGHGTVGVGVGATWEREKNLYSLRIKDLLYPAVFKIKLEQIYDYYISLGMHLSSIADKLADLHEVGDTCYSLLDNSRVEFENFESHPSTQYVYEGSQGLLLDQDFGFFPNVTHSSVGSRNIFNLMNLEDEVLDIYYVTRAYQTRHGNGPMTNEDIPHTIKEFEHEKNVTNEYQGEFRISVLDLDLIEYSLDKDIRDTREYWPCVHQRNLVVTCLDALDDYTLTYHGKLYVCNNEDHFLTMIFKMLNVDALYVSRSPVSTELELIKRK